jgi:hypothetical protein
MELPPGGAEAAGDWTLRIRHPGGVGDILHSADGGSWLAGSIEHAEAGKRSGADREMTSELQVVAIA